MGAAHEELMWVRRKLARSALASAHLCGRTVPRWDRDPVCPCISPLQGVSVREWFNLHTLYKDKAGSLAATTVSAPAMRANRGSQLAPILWAVHCSETA